MNKVKTHCKRGHEFTPENTLTRQNRGALERTCRICRRAASAAYELTHTDRHRIRRQKAVTR